jgi:hypothetical protein
MNMHSNLTDKQRRIEAMYHLEACFETGGNRKERPLEEMQAHIWAAHYLIATMGGGRAPSNYDEVMLRAMEFDATDAAKEAIYLASKKA